MSCVYYVVLRRIITCNLFISILMLATPSFGDETNGYGNSQSMLGAGSGQAVQWKHPTMTNFSRLYGNFDLNISGGKYNTISGTGVRNVIDGNINIELDNVHQETIIPGENDETGIYGSIFMASGMSNVHGVMVTDEVYAALQQKILGTTNIMINNSVVQSKVIGHNFFQDSVSELIDSGAIGKTTITLNNTSVERGLYGVNFGANPIFSGVNFGDIELNINNSYVREGVVAAGANASAGNVVINVRGNSVIGYTDSTATTPYLDEGGWIIAGGNQNGATIASTIVNLDTVGIDNTINIGGDVYPGARYRDENPSGIVAGNATLNMAGGGTINVGNNIHAYNVNGRSKLNIVNVTANVGGDIIGFDEITIGANGILNANTLVLSSDDTVNIVLQDQNNYGKIVLNNLNANGAQLNIILGSTGEYDFLTTTNVNSNFIWNLQNPLFNVSHYNGVITARQKTMEEIAAYIGANNDVANAMSAFSHSDNNGAKRINIAIQNAIAHGDTEYVKTEVSKINPSVSPVATSVALGVQNHILSEASKRLSLALTGRNGGDVHADLGFWAKGTYNKTKHKNLLSSNTWGTSVGFDTDLNHNIILGLGYLYGQTDVDLKASNIDIDSNTIFGYAQYRNNNWFVNGMIGYTMSKYDRYKTVFGMNYDTEYHVNSFSEQLMSGYRFANGVTPILGLRYLDVHSKSYFDGLTMVGDTDSTYLTGIAGVDYIHTWVAPHASLFWNPELHAALTYDMVSDEGTTFVMVPGSVVYTVAMDNLSRLGGEFGVGLSAEYYYLTVSLNYDLNIHRDFTSQTGSLKVKYKF